MTDATRRFLRVALVAAALLCATGRPARAQLGTLASPGPLSRAHASLEGLANCQKCHEPGRQVTAGRCLACHKPIADRMARKTGVHRDVTDDCVTCHVEHAGVDAELRPFDAARFDHAAETGFPLDGLHAPLARECSRCHKTRSFLTLSPACASCHSDVHKGTLGSACATCHATGVPFRQASRTFDHGRSAFPLAGAHRDVACARCHRDGRFKGLAFQECSACHRDPHVQRFGPACSTCHDAASWRTEKVDHAKTAFTLVGRHRTVQCAACHRQPPMRARLAFSACASCHADPHKGTFKERCETCHDETGFTRAGSTFDHAARTAFPLDGRHAGLPCSKCHTGAAAAGPASPRARGRPAAAASRTLDYRGLEAACASCHADPHKGELGAGCARCHSSATFAVKTFTHEAHPELFRGAHATAACAACHARRGPTAPVRTGATLALMQFKGVPAACASCHDDPHLGQVGTACETCHDAERPTFALAGFSHDRARFALTGAHRDVPCEKCHRIETAAFPGGRGTARRLTGLAADCASCHRDEHEGQLGPRCETCHTTKTFGVTEYTHRGLEGFFVGRHARLACAACHKREAGGDPERRAGRVRFKTGAECSACHEDAHQGAMRAPCATCHSPEQWEVATRGFHKSTRFPLEGRHLAVPCQACHVDGQLAGTPTRCFDCHWIRRQDDRYETRLGSACEECHRPASWTAVRWDHGTITGTPLNAAHRLLACDSCHRERRFAGTRPECVACHERSFREAKDPDHVAAGFPTQCDLCHEAVSPTFAGAHFTHAAFPLVGPHAIQPCAACHRTGVYQGTPRDCAGCHLTDYQRTQNPDHAAAGFPTACETCHRPAAPSWAGATFNHAEVFALNGTHGQAACQSCHRSGQYRGTPRDCYSCHRAEYERTQNPNHAAAGFPTTCQTCHRDGGPGWANSGFNHAQVFPLNGTHGQAACQSCHRSGQYRGTPRDCYSCHRAEYERTQNPNHAAAGFPTTCQTCHRDGGPGWANSGFNHAQVFPLNGTHGQAACQSCHRSGQYRGTPRDCYSCHRAEYERTQNPNHAAAGFSTGCEACHRSGGPGWKGASIDHTQFWPLLGAHNTAACTSCHRNDQYRGTPRDCFPCHQPQYQQAQNPNHAGAGFPTACDQCHRNGGPGWRGAAFNHSQFFPLQGVHASQACTACHRTGQYRGTPRDCAGCHLARYQATRNPNHQAAGFPTTCETCHRATDTSWAQGRFDHAWFPITSGPHSGRPCSACHLDAGNYRVFSCLTCHDRAKTDSKHKNRPGYVYDSMACYSCHPTGKG